jgi:hypothetical protein
LLSVSSRTQPVLLSQLRTGLLLLSTALASGQLGAERCSYCTRPEHVIEIAVSRMFIERVLTWYMLLKTPGKFRARDVMGDDLAAVWRERGGRH